MTRTAARDELFESCASQTLCLWIFQELITVVKGHSDAHHLVGELLGIDVFPELFFFDGGLHDSGDGLLPVGHFLDQQVSDGARPIVEFLGEGHEHAAAFPVMAANPIEVTVKQCADARLTPRLGQCRQDHCFGETTGNFPQNFKLQLFFRPEMREEAALRAVEGGGQNAQGQTFEADFMGDGEGAVDNSLVGVEVAFHKEIVVRPVGRVNAEFLELRETYWRCVSAF